LFHGFGLRRLVDVDLVQVVHASSGMRAIEALLQVEPGLPLVDAFNHGTLPYFGLLEVNSPSVLLEVFLEEFGAEKGPRDCLVNVVNCHVVALTIPSYQMADMFLDKGIELSLPQTRFVFCCELAEDFN